MIVWSCKHFTQLTNEDLYKILQLRNQIFVVEQNCPYQDCDDKDQHSFHLLGQIENAPAAYARLLPPGLAFREPSIGRVLTAFSARGKNAGRALMLNSIDGIYTLFGKLPIRIGAQLYLKKFYESLGFSGTSEIYLEDGIEHIEMLKSAPAGQ